MIQAIRDRTQHHYGKRLVYSCVDYIEEELAKEEHSLGKTIQNCAKKFSTPRANIYRWWNFYKDWGEIGIVIRKRMTQLRKKCKLRRTVTQLHIQALRRIVDNHPEYYLDEFAEELAYRTNSTFALSTISRVIKEEFNLSLQVCHEVARQRNENERKLYKHALCTLLSVFEDLGMLVYIDETHKDRNASRRRRAWGKKNSGGVKLDRWFKNTVRYTMIIACNINGFMTKTCQLVERDEISDEGAAGTVDGEAFKQWVENFLVPSLGDFSKGEKNSIVVMDNASTHMCYKVKDMINAKGAVLLYTAPYSPDLNPIEMMFNIYKSYLKRHEYEFAFDPIGTHWKAVHAVSGDDAIMEFRKCEVPFSEDVLTSDEMAEELFIAMNQMNTLYNLSLLLNSE